MSELTQRGTASANGSSANKRSCNPAHSPNACSKNTRLFVPLSVPLERRKQTLAIGAWLTLFFGSIVALGVVLAVWLYIAFTTLRYSYGVYVAVYGTTSYYGSEKDREELAPRLSDYVDGPFAILVGEFILLTVLIAVVLRRWRMSPWSTANRRLFPTRANGRAFSPEHEMVTDSWPSRKFARLYVSWSRCLTSYFPHKVVFDDESLDEEQIHALFPEDTNYLFACHPHGMASISFWATFCWRPTLSQEARVQQTTGYQHSDTPMRRFMERYFVYGLDYGAPVAAKTAEEAAAHRRKAYALVLHTLDVNFIQPLWRELVLRVGLRDVSRRSILNSIGRVDADALTMEERKDKWHMSRISCIVVGGAAESIDHNRHGHLTLRKRKGFIRMCVETGASVVPVYAFGENDLYGGAENTMGRDGREVEHWSVALNRKSQKLLGFALPFARGRGFFNYAFGIIPHRRPLTTVIGAPIAVKRVLRPKKGDANHDDLLATFNAEVDRVHAIYVANLCALYRRHQPALDPNCPVKELFLK